MRPSPFDLWIEGHYTDFRDDHDENDLDGHFGLLSVGADYVLSPSLLVGTLLQFDYDHPPKPPKPNRLWHLGKVVFNKTYWHTVPKGRV